MTNTIQALGIFLNKFAKYTCATVKMLNPTYPELNFSFWEYSQKLHNGGN
jgi:hypothetical protein